MKLDHDCTRDLLLELEEKLGFNDTLFKNQIINLNICQKFGEEQIYYTIFRLKEARFINVNWQYASDALYSLSVSSITWEGHQFLDNIREPDIWKAAKNKVKGLTSVSISILAEVAQEYLNKKLIG